MNFTGAGVTVTESPTGTAQVDIPGLQFWTESETAATQQNTRWIPNNVAADVTAVVQPKGTGANTAQRPDGTTTGGNARGNYATDWQKRRGNANQVASGTDSVISGGRNNRASGADSTVSGGRDNIASGTNSTVIGGTGNTASQTSSTAIGQENTSSAAYSTTHGISNVASGLYAFASGVGSTATAEASTALGFSSNSYLYAARSNSSGASVWQEQVCLARRLVTLNSEETANLSLDGTGTSSLIIPLQNYRSWTVEISWVAGVRIINGTATGVAVGDTISGKDILCLKRVNGTSSLVGATTSLFLVSDTSMSTAGLAYSIGGSNNLQLTFTAPTFAGGGSLNTRIVAKVSLTESSTQF
jgi:hypothetical protein